MRRADAVRGGLRVGLAGLLVGGLSVWEAVVAQLPGDVSRRVIVLSDLHMGMGRDITGAWHVAEDFRWAEEFEPFLDTLAADDVPTDLILNGDTFELVEASDRVCVHDEETVGCSTSEALIRLERVLSAHTREVAALSRFLAAGDHRLVLVPGDRDAALLFPTVGARVLEAFEAASGRVRVADEGEWRSADDAILVEHGHQLETRADRYANWPFPFVERNDGHYLERPWGQRLVGRLYDDLEPQFPVVDDVADAGGGVRFGLSAAGVPDLQAETAALLRYLLFRMSWQQFRMDLDRGDVEPPVWDISAVRASGPSFLVESLPDDDRFKMRAVNALTAGGLDRLLAALTDDELVMVCDYRAATRRARRRFERILTQLDPTGPPVTECPRTPETDAPQYEYYWRARDEIFGTYLAQRQGARPLAIMVHGHTHLADYRQGNFTRVEVGRAYVVDGFSPSRNATTPIVINGGAWRRTVTPRQLHEYGQQRGLSDRELLSTVQPEQLPPCYSFVEIAPYTDEPAPPVLRYWREDADGVWGMAPRCGRGLAE